MLVCRWVLLLLKRVPRFIGAILRRLFSQWGFRGGQWIFSLMVDEEKKTPGRTQRRCSLPSGKAPRSYKACDDGKSSVDTCPTQEGLVAEPNLSYAAVDDGEIISLDDVSCSVFPFPVGRTSRSPSRLSRTPSRSSAFTNSGSHENHITVSIEDPEGTQNHTNLAERGRLGSLLSETSLASLGSVRQTTQSPKSRWLHMKHISPAVPIETQRYHDRPTM